MNEILIVSGKGGTGKTSITAALATHFGDIVLADCDVDASDLHLLLTPQLRHAESFVSGHEAQVNQADCTKCMKCEDACRFGAVKTDARGGVFIDAIACEGCGVCAWICPEKAISFEERICGQWFFSETRYGPMIHAKLEPAAENSGKLVSEVRFQAKLTASQTGLDTILIDGAPGIGCPVIASMSGVGYVLVVTEPTLSGEHDMQRIVSLARHFDTNVYVCINKYDINPDMTAQIEAEAARNAIKVIGKIPYDKAFTQAQIAGETIEEYGKSDAARAVRDLFTELKKEMDKDHRQ